MGLFSLDQGSSGLRPSQMGFLGNLVKVFPSLASRPLHLTGESYAGTYIASSHLWINECGLSISLIIAIYHESLFQHDEPPSENCKGCLGESYNI